MKRHNCGEESGSTRPSAELTDEAAFLCSLISAVLSDISMWSNFDFTRDVATINQRVRSEGISFLTKALPLYGKTVLNGLRVGSLVLPADFPFKRKFRGRVHPAFLHDILIRVFDNDGNERDDADPGAVCGLEQICFMFYKYDMPLHQSVYDAAFAKLWDHERSTHATQACLNAQVVEGSDNSLRRIFAHAQELLSQVLDGYDHESVVPRHGPGAVAIPRLEPHEKYNFRDFPQETESRFPKLEWTRAPFTGCVDLVPLHPHVDRPDRRPAWRGHYPIRETLERVSRTIGVPKDSRGPRVINAEQHELMYLQEGIWLVLRELIENHPLTKGHVNFRNQVINGDLALEGSRNQTWATIDLRQASDSVLYWHVYQLFTETVFADLRATRSVATWLPVQDGVDVLCELNKFAPMGSATCFPVEALVFWAICVAAIKDRHPAWGYDRCARLVYVYGDDIIVPTTLAEHVISALEESGFSVNTEKSYFSGWFRESCGVDAYRGEVVTPHRVKTRLPRARSDISGILSWIEYSNQFYMDGYYSAAALIARRIEDLLGEPLPILPRNAGAPGWVCRHDTHKPSQGWKSAGHVGRLNGKVKLRGNGWATTESRRNFGPYSKRRRCLVVDAIGYEPPESDFSEESALLRYFCESRKGVPSWKELFDGSGGVSSARHFVKRDQLRWGRREVIIS